MIEKRTPMAWQHRDMNYHQHGYHQGAPNGYGHGMEVSRGPPSTSDRVSHRTDKSWKTRDSSSYPVQGSTSGHVNASYPRSPSADPFLAAGPFERSSRAHSAGTSSSSTSTSSDESERHTRAELVNGIPRQPPMHPLYGQVPQASGYIPPHPYTGSLKPAHSVPAIAVPTYDGEPCPVHGMGIPNGAPPSIAMVPQMMPPDQIAYTQHSGMPMHPSMPTLPRKAASIYDMRLMSPPPPTPSMPIYGTLPSKPGMIPADRRSLVGYPGSGPPQHIPPHLLPPMSRPQRLVLSEDGIPEPLPVRTPNKNGLDLEPKLYEGIGPPAKWKGCSKGTVCVAWIIICVVCTGIILGMLLMFIL